MNTPICDFVKKYADSNTVRAHMPGHKGKGSAEKFDITEIDGADVLYGGEGIIAESQKNASVLFDTKKTVYSCEGSSLSIRAMLYLTKMYALSKGEKCRILAGRNAHKVFITASALLNIDVDWIFPEENEGITVCKITAEKLQKELSYLNEKPTAVYVTSPDYLGNITDLKSLSAVCEKEGILFLVDNAHGAYLHFLTESLHPMDLGASMCCDSAHKTLPVLTGGAYLHIGKNAPDIISEKASAAMSLFASTSPSYLILQSLDNANKYLFNGYREKLSSFVKKTEELKKSLIDKGYELTGQEPLKITVSTKSYGYKGNEFAGLLLKKGIVCEFSDPDYVCLMLTPENTDEELISVRDAFFGIERKKAIEETVPLLKKPKRYCSAEKALFSFSEKCNLSECEGRVLSDVTVSCPPAVPVAVCGEVIDKDSIEVMKYYGITTLDVMK